MAVSLEAQKPTDPMVRMLYTFDEAAAWLNMSARLVRVLVDDQRLPSVHIGRLHRIAHEDLVAFVASLRKHD